MSPVTDQTSPLTQKTSDKLAQFGLQPLHRSPEVADLNPILEDTNSIVEESVDSEHSDINYSKEEESQQNDNRSTENEKKTGEDQSQLMSERSHCQSVDTPNQGISSVTDQTASLTRKVSERFTPFSLQPLYRSPEGAGESPMLQDTEYSVDESVGGESSKQNCYHEEMPQQLEIRPAEKEVQLHNQANDTFCGDVRKGIEEALSKSSVPFTAINRGQNEIHSEDDQKTKNLHNIQEKGNDQETEPINQSVEYFE